MRTLLTMVFDLSKYDSEMCAQSGCTKPVVFFASSPLKNFGPQKMHFASYYCQYHGLKFADYHHIEMIGKWPRSHWKPMPSWLISCLVFIEKACHKLRKEPAP